MGTSCRNKNTGEEKEVINFPSKEIIINKVHVGVLKRGHVRCPQAEGHTAHIGSAPLQSPDACSRSAATPKTAILNMNNTK